MKKSIEKSKRIGSFAEFCNPKHKKTIKENSELSIEVPFWDSAIQLLLDRIREIAGEQISWEKLVNYVKTKFIITGRDLIEDEDRLVLSFISDNLFQSYGETWFDGDAIYTLPTAELGSKALVLSTLADEILQRVKEEAGQVPIPEPDTPYTVSKVYLTDPYEFDDYCGEGTVASFSKFSKFLKESIDKITIQDDGKALDYVLNKIEKDAGSLKLDDVLKVVQQEEFRNLEEYVSSIADEYMSDFKIELNGDKVVDKNVLKSARKLFAYQITREVLDKISKETQSKK
jgi:hypothetical protein